jgi:hypothetical protein
MEKAITKDTSTPINKWKDSGFVLESWRADRNLHSETAGAKIFQSNLHANKEISSNFKFCSIMELFVFAQTTLSTH